MDELPEINAKSTDTSERAKWYRPTLRHIDVALDTQSGSPGTGDGTNNALPT
ncbi:MAG: hypothetical protein VYB54_14765 [Pseudomonadota bacterium]|nr:hypothetical protein [Pseudomonadota bacterium]